MNKFVSNLICIPKFPNSNLKIVTFDSCHPVLVVLQPHHARLLDRFPADRANLPLVQPVQDANPAEQVTTLGGTQVYGLLHAEGALALRGVVRSFATAC